MVDAAQSRRPPATRANLSRRRPDAQTFVNALSRIPARAARHAQARPSTPNRHCVSIIDHRSTEFGSVENEGLGKSGSFAFSGISSASSVSAVTDKVPTRFPLLDAPEARYGRSERSVPASFVSTRKDEASGMRGGGLEPPRVLPH